MHAGWFGGSCGMVVVCTARYADKRIKPTIGVLRAKFFGLIPEFAWLFMSADTDICAPLMPHLCDGMFELLLNELIITPEPIFNSLTLTTGRSSVLSPGVSQNLLGFAGWTRRAVCGWYLRLADKEGGKGRTRWLCRAQMFPENRFADALSGLRYADRVLAFSMRR